MQQLRRSTKNTSDTVGLAAKAGMFYSLALQAEQTIHQASLAAFSPS
jgi:hypothetical protein